MKEYLRKQCLKIRFRDVNEKDILERVEQLVLKFSKIAFYQHIGSELSMESLINKFFLSKKIYLPYSSNIIHFRQFIGWNHMIEDDYHILSPNTNDEQLQNIEVIVIPCVACNTSGYRLGYDKVIGMRIKKIKNLKGIKKYYISDNGTISISFIDEDGKEIKGGNYQGIKIGVIDEKCLLDEHFEEKHDIKLDYIVTEKRIIEVK